MPPKLQAQVHSLLARSDERAMHLTRVLATPSGIDRFLMTIYYTMKLVYPQLARLRYLRTQKYIQDFISKASASLLPGETLIAPFSALVPPVNSLQSLEASARALADMISDFRIFVRCWGLLGIYAWGRDTYVNPPEDAMIKWLVWGQVWVNTGFQMTENVAYLASKGVLRGARFGADMQNRWWVYSSRFWVAHIVMEAARLLRTWKLSIEDDKVDVKGVEADKVEAAQVWSRAWYVNLAYFPIAVHYSTANGCMTDEWLGFFGVIVGSIGFRHLWKLTT